LLKSQAISTQTQGQQLQIFTHVMKRKHSRKQIPLIVDFSINLYESSVQGSMNLPNRILIIYSRFWICYE